MAYFKATSSEYRYICIIVVTIHFFVSGKATLPCRPAEEGKPYTLSAPCFPKGHGETTVYWVKAMSVFSECTLEKCSDRNENLTRTALTITSTGDYVSTLHLYNVHRHSTGLWRLKYPRLAIDDCKLEVFAKPKSLQCHMTILSEGITVNCKAHRVFPKIKCGYSVKINKRSKDFTNFTTTLHEQIKGEMEFYNSTCLLTIPVSRVEIGRLEIEPKIQLEFANDLVPLDVSYSVDLNIDKPKITLHSCRTSEMGVTCSCKVQESPLKYSLAWYNSNGEVIQEGSEISQNYTNIAEDYFCLATNVLGIKSEPVFLSRSVGPSVGSSIGLSDPSFPIRLGLMVLGSVIGGILLITIAIVIIFKRYRTKRICYKQEQCSIEKISDFPSAYNPLYNQTIVNQTLPYQVKEKMVYLSADDDEAKIYSSIDY
ncbi:hypothetical protein BgiMline_031574 [Biomphalaria glabrata]|nr:hypothetical protein BgiMline_019787 [Biomphalaria glabrata]